MIKNRIKALRNKFIQNNIDGYIVPKNDKFFSEYVYHDRLKIISGFNGSAGLAIILKNKNYLFVDGRYTIQAKQQSGKNFKIIEIHKFLPQKTLKNLTLGYDPKLFTKTVLNIYFGNSLKLKSIDRNLVDSISNKKTSNYKPFYSINDSIVGEAYKSKISSVSKILKNKKVDYLFISAPENVAWILNIRGSDVPYSPIPNCNLIIEKNKKVFLIAEKFKIMKLLKEKKIRKDKIVDPKNLSEFIKNLNGKRFIIDAKTCSVFNEKIITSKFLITSRFDPCYSLKSIKNSVEIKHMINAHIEDGVALTKFIFWMKNLGNKKISELQTQNKLESFRKKNKNYLFPSFNTIAGTGSNGAIVHYKATKKSNKIVKKNHLFLCDSGGQYSYGTTDVTRTICFTKQPNQIKNIFTKVLKGHIAVVTSNLSKITTGKQLDTKARKFLKKSGLDYAHGTGHGVGFFLNVHEGPQSISKYNLVKLQEGMILSNEPGYYKKGKYGIRIENLVFIRKNKNKLGFENLTLAPIDKDLINYKLLNNYEKDYLFRYHLLVYSKLSKFLNNNEKKWLISTF